MLEDKSYIVLDESANIIPKEDYDFEPSTWKTGVRAVGEGVSFRPVRGTEEKILAGPVIDGYLYFATDTGRIFLAKGFDLIPMGGGGVEIFYAHAEPEDIKEDAGDGYYLTFDVLDDPEASIGENDLIINNTSSGSGGQFFRVESADRETNVISCKRIAVSGTGSGGGDIGGGGSGPGGTVSQIKMEFIESVKLSYIYGQPANIVVRTTSEADDLNIIYAISITASDGTKINFQESVANGELFTFDIGSKLFKGFNKITISATGGTSLVSTGNKTYTNINSIEMKLNASKNFNPLEAKTMGSFPFYCTPVGVGLTKTLRIYIDGELDDSLTQSKVTTSGQDIGITISGLSHGSHKIKAVLSTGSGATEVFAPALEYEIGWIESDNDLPVIWTNNVPSQIIDHEKLTIEYKIYNPAFPAKADAHLYIDQEEIPTSPVEVGYDTAALTWEKWSITNYKIGMNVFTISCGSVSKTFEIEVVEDELRDLNIIETGLALSLDSKGRSNKENKTSRETWTYTDASKNTTAVKFNNFNWYNNGWIIDDNGDSCLRISNGASISIPLSVMNVSDLTNALTFEFQFKLRNVQNLSTLVTTTSREENDKVIIEKTVNTEEGVFANYYKNDIGFCLGTQEAFFRASGGSLVNARYTDGQMVNISFVIQAKSSNTPLMYIYLNGILSGIANYANGESFASMATELVFNSTYCDVDLYKVRVYKSELTPINVVHNYIADMASADLYDENQIAIFENNIPLVDFQKIIDYNTNHPDSPTMPYAVLEIAKADKAYTDERLPFVKGGKRLVDVTFVNPSLDRAYELFKNGENIENMTSDNDYVESCPSFYATNVQFDVQGTSSQGYPRRNYKGKFKQNKDKNVTWTYTNGPLKDRSLLDKVELNGKKYKYYYMDNADAAESTFTWKADYMESSGTHNTGFASFVKTLYSKHPLADYLTGYVSGDHRTTVYGFPMMVFQKKHDGTYQFIGKYNFNLDKGCNNVIDFKNETAHPYVTGTFLEEQDDGTTIEKPLDFAHIAECWELCNNQGTRCSFQVVNFEQINEKGQLTVLDDFEYRYLYDEDTMDDAIDAKTTVFPTQEEANAYILDKMSNLEKVANWLNSTSTDATQITGAELPEPVIYGTKTYTHDTREYRLAKFTYEFQDHFNFEYCAIYFIMTELILGYDSRGKNLMLASWGPQKLGGEYIWYPIFYDIDTQLGINNSGVPTWEYDTEATKTGQFSTSNSVLWNNLWECFKQPIKDLYIELRKNELTIEKLNGYYDFDPEVSKSFAMMGSRPINMVNIDEYFKYIAPAFTGYTDTSGNNAWTTLYFYCLQGNRELQRKMFLRNRFNYIDSEWLGGPYSKEAVLQELKLRYNANDVHYTSDKYLTKAPSGELVWNDKNLNGKVDEGEMVSNEGFEVMPYPQPLDANANFVIEPYLKQYVGVYFDDTPTTPILYDGENPVTVVPIASIQEKIESSPNLTQQLVYLGGIEYISKFGDMSLKYVNEFAMQKAIRLKELILGNENSEYFNAAMSDEYFNLAAGATAQDIQGNTISNPLGKPLLEKIVLTNIGTISSPQDLTSCEKLKTFRALGTNLGGVLLADGVPIETLYLPKSITYFNLTEPVNLNKLLTTRPVANGSDEFPKGLYIEGITDKETITATDTTKINSIDIRGGNMNYTSYQILDKVKKIKEVMQIRSDLGTDFNKNLRINMENVAWTPYRLVQAGEAIIEEATYVKKTNHYTFEPYTASNDTWKADTLNGKIYEYNATLFNENANVITSLEMLDDFITSFEGPNATNFFKSTTEYADNRNTIPYISGDIFINNPSSSKISEFDIFEKYNNIKHFPDLNIFVANVDNAYVANFVEILDSGKEYEWDSIKYNKSVTTYPSATTVIPTKLHYDFKGWATKPDALPEDVITDWTQFKFADNDTYTFYAIYDRHPYKFTFHYDDDEEPYVKEVLYNDYVGIPTEIYPYKDASELELTECYGFKYYVNAKDSTIKVDLTTLKAVKDQEFWAYFEPISVYDNVISKDYFYINRQGHIINKRKEDNPGIGSAVINSILKGKITLPTNGAKAVGTGALQLAENITHVFFENSNNSSLTEINSHAFNNLKNAVYIEIPSTVTSIGTNAFSSCRKVKYIGPPVENIDTSERIVKLAGNITTLENEIFNYNGVFNELTIGTSESDLWQIVDDSTVADNVSGNAVFNNLVVYRDPATQNFITPAWLVDKFGRYGTSNIK